MKSGYASLAHLIRYRIFLTHHFRILESCSILLTSNQNKRYLIMVVVLPDSPSLYLVICKVVLIAEWIRTAIVSSAIDAYLDTCQIFSSSMLISIARCITANGKGYKVLLENDFGGPFDLHFYFQYLPMCYLKIVTF